MFPQKIMSEKAQVVNCPIVKTATQFGDVAAAAFSDAFISLTFWTLMSELGHESLVELENFLLQRTHFTSLISFVDASSHLYKRICPSVCLSVGPERLAKTSM